MAEASALQAPDSLSRRREGEQGAGQLPQGAADRIAPQHHPARAATDLEVHHPAAGPALDHLDTAHCPHGGSPGRHGLGEAAGRELPLPAEAGMVGSIGPAIAL